MLSEWWSEGCMRVILACPTPGRPSELTKMHLVLLASFVSVAVVCFQQGYGTHPLFTCAFA